MGGGGGGVRRSFGSFVWGSEVDLIQDSRLELTIPRIHCRFQAKGWVPKLRGKGGGGVPARLRKTKCTPHMLAMLLNLLVNLVTALGMVGGP